jgi:TctA family transporter
VDKREEKSVMWDALATSLVHVFSGWTPAYLLLGVAVGLVIGVLPALGTTAGMALLMPFVYGMEPAVAISMMIGLLAVVATGDTVTSILVGIPGGSSSQATVLDGFPMAKNGEAARALSAAYFSSMIGGVFGAIVLSGAIVIAKPIILSFGVGEMLMLVILGITMVSALSGASLVKGFISCGLGLIFGTIGAAPATGEYRLSFDSLYLSDGLQLTVISLAIFAIPEVVDLLRRGQAISKVASIGSGWRQGVVDTLRNTWLVLRSSVIGCIIGALPIGGSDWIAYGHAVQTCKPRDRFGKGDVRGVIAPEAANNANSGGALVPALIFGIPGSGSTAIFLGGLILLGIQPGPSMLSTNLDLTYQIIWSLALANIFGAGFCFLMSGHIAKITTVPFVYVAPFLLTVIFFGALQSGKQFGDLITLFAVGTFAVFLRRFGYSRPAFLIGFVLSHNIETLLYQTIQIYSFERLFSRPLIWILLAINIASLVFGLRSRPKMDTEGKSQTLTAAEVTPQILFAACLLLLVGYNIFETRDLNFLGRVFPWTVSLVTAGFIAVSLVPLARRDMTNSAVYDSEVRWRHREEAYETSLYHYLYWIGGFIIATFLFGFIAAIALFFVVFLRTKSEASWIGIILMAASAICVLLAIGSVFVIDFPTGIIQDMVFPP